MWEIPLDLLLSYARCPLLYWWRARAKIEAPATVEALPERAVRQGLARYYQGRVVSVVDGVLAVWREWLTEWGCPPGTLDGLQRYGEVEAALLMPFVDGTLRRDDGTPYQAPRMTRRYQEQARGAGLPQLSKDLRRAMGALPLHAAREDYDAVTAFSDAILMALRYQGPRRDPEGGTRVAVPFRIPLTDGVTITGQADLVVLKEGQVRIAEVHDYGPYRPPARAVPRHLAVIALSHACGEGWEGGRSIVYRHLWSGFSVKVSQPESCGRLLPVLTAAVRGVQCGVFLPRLAVAERDCLSCPYYGLCVTEDGLDVLDDLDATLAGIGGARRSAGPRTSRLRWARRGGHGAAPS